MMKIGKTIVRSYMTLKHSFSGIRLQETILTPVDWNIEVQMASIERPGRSHEEFERSVAIAYQKIYYWLDINLSRCIMVDVTNPTDLYISHMVGNVAMHYPGSPGDDMLVELLHAKLSKLAGKDIFIGQVSASGSDLSVKYSFDVQDSHYNLPAKTNEYLEDIEAKEEIPWWFRDDGFCFDFLKSPNAELDNEMFNSIVDPMEEFYAMLDQLSEENKEPATIVRLDKWKPKKV